MQNAKTGLRLITVSILLSAVWMIVLSILTSVNKDSTIVLRGSLITSIVNLACYVIELIGLFMAGKDNKRFKLASKLKIGNIGIAVIQIILSSVANAINNQGVLSAISIVAIVLTVLSLALEIIILINIIKGCKEIAPRVSGLSKFVLGSFVVQAILLILSYILITINNEKAQAIAAIFGLIAALIVVVFAICYLILIFRTTANVGKPRK